MSRRGTITRLLPFLLIAVVATLALTGCSEDFSSPQNTFAPAGDVAEGQKNDFLLVMWPALAIMIGVFAAILFIAVRFRRKKGDPGLPKQTHGNTALELTWTILPALLLAVIAVPTVQGIRDLAAQPEGAMRVDVTGIQWAWQFDYPELEVGGAPYTEIGELHIPVNRDIALTIRSNDVNHSFWVPKLAGKTDAIQTHPNEMWMRATRTGTYLGQCAEFCGIGHSGMRLAVIVMSEEDFAAWAAERIAEGGGPGGGAPPDVPAGDATPAGEGTATTDGE